MKENTSNKNQIKNDGKESAGNYLSGQNASPCPSAAGPLTPADGQTVEYAGDKSFNAHDGKDSMAVSVTRHALSPHVAVLQNHIVRGYSEITIILAEYAMTIQQYELLGRESSMPTNSLHEKAEQYQSVWRVAGSLHRYGITYRLIS
jgi:hypothetical protein